MFYHLQLLIHHLQVIRHKNPSHLSLIINTVLQIKIRTAPQIQMTSTHVLHHKKNYSFQDTYTPPLFTPVKNTLPIAPVELHTTKKLPPTDKEYLCFQINSKSHHAAQFAY